MVSPNELFEAGKRITLDGRNPESRKDWVKMVSFWALNIHSGLEESACQLLAKIFRAPLSEEEIVKIVEFQVRLK
jgi:hypothetical protein